MGREEEEESETMEIDLSLKLDAQEQANKPENALLEKHEGKLHEAENSTSLDGKSNRRFKIEEVEFLKYLFFMCMFMHGFVCGRTLLSSHNLFR